MDPAEVDSPFLQRQWKDFRSLLQRLMDPAAVASPALQLGLMRTAVILLLLHHVAATYTGEGSSLGASEYIFSSGSNLYRDSNGCVQFGQRSLCDGPPCCSNVFDATPTPPCCRNEPCLMFSFALNCHLSYLNCHAV